MTSKRFCVLALICGLLIGALPALAHHSGEAEFQMHTMSSIKGVLSKVEWDNPHVYWTVDVKDASGKVVHWSIEGVPPGYLHRAGYTRQAMLALVGTTITVNGHLAKDGSPLMRSLNFVLPDGKVLTVGSRSDNGDDYNFAK